MTTTPLKTLILTASVFALAACGSLGDMLPGQGSRRTAPPPPSSGPGPGLTPSDPPVTEARICDLAKQAVREAMNVPQLRGETCSATHTRPGEWQAKVNFMSGSEQQTYRVALQPHRQRQEWGVLDLTPETRSS
ncbi:hypothetical protein [Reyranella sp. CPCC 100927]|uniref:hypothetical protein n=1 Tax=Reyranella sp. CPCC 100927 TaxID=2599616 RepID=UPI0011B6E159|nr:hypothetical protein [Reyranella sp. CPCC 100927]TWS99689.1 hypothetical protein FQU96_35040 [Reyranella sp. CPCC 100927]